MKARLFWATVLIINSLLAIASGDDIAIVIIKDYKFIPANITIKKGQAIRWQNQEKRQYHSVWFESLGEEEPEDYLFPEDLFERNFDQAGTFPYRCGPHPEMLGTITVTE